MGGCDRRARGGGTGDAVFGLGLVGAEVAFWRQADGFGEHLVGVLKGLVWPAFLVHDALEALAG